LDNIVCITKNQCKQLAFPYFFDCEDDLFKNGLFHHKDNRRTIPWSFTKPPTIEIYKGLADFWLCLNFSTNSNRQIKML